jgi:hypothetical protein
MELLRKLLFNTHWVIIHYIRIHSVPMSWVLLKAQLVMNILFSER